MVQLAIVFCAPQQFTVQEVPKGNIIQMTITQLLQSSPAKANELFAKLTSTTNGAIKTRESLFDDLRAELELHSRIEEEHLFPALRKHEETKSLVRNAISDNKRARALLDELATMPKDSDDFLGKVEELQQAFQQHVRDEKKELLPAVRTVLTKEEAQTIAAKVEADKAMVEETKRQEAENERAAAQQAREQAGRLEARKEARLQRAREEEKRKEAAIRAEQRQARQEEKQRQAEAEEARRQSGDAEAALARTGGNAIRTTQSLLALGPDAAQAGADAVVENTRQMAGMVNAAVEDNVVAFTRAAHGFTGQATLEQLAAFGEFPQTATRAAAETGVALLELMRSNAQSRAQRTLGLMGCITPGQLAQVHTRYVGETMRNWFEANARLLDASLGVYRSLARPRRSSAESREKLVARRVCESGLRE